MATPEPSTAIAGLSIAGILAAVPFGINVETIATGMGFAIVGMLGRFAFDLQKAVESGTPLGLGKTLQWLGAGFIGAPFLTIAWLVFLKQIGAATDTATVIGLLLLGFSGPKGISWLLGLLNKLLPQNGRIPDSQLPGAKP
jgi:hypothetical protein